MDGDLMGKFVVGAPKRVREALDFLGTLEPPQKKIAQPTALHAGPPPPILSPYGLPSGVTTGIPSYIQMADYEQAMKAAAQRPCTPMVSSSPDASPVLPSSTFRPVSQSASTGTPPSAFSFSTPSAGRRSPTTKPAKDEKDEKEKTVRVSARDTADSHAIMDEYLTNTVSTTTLSSHTHDAYEARKNTRFLTPNLKFDNPEDFDHNVHGAYKDFWISPKDDGKRAGLLIRNGIITATMRNGDQFVLNDDRIYNRAAADLLSTVFLDCEVITMPNGVILCLVSAALGYGPSSYAAKPFAERQRRGAMIVQKLNTFKMPDGSEHGCMCQNHDHKMYIVSKEVCSTNTQFQDMLTRIRDPSSTSIHDLIRRAFRMLCTHDQAGDLEIVHPIDGFILSRSTKPIMTGRSKYVLKFKPWGCTVDYQISGIRSGFLHLAIGNPSSRVPRAAQDRVKEVILARQDLVFQYIDTDTKVALEKLVSFGRGASSASSTQDVHKVPLHLVPQDVLRQIRAKISAQNGPCIVECLFNRKKNAFDVLQIRDDKSRPNFHTTQACADKSNLSEWKMPQFVKWAATSLPY